jgi:membrane protein
VRSAVANPRGGRLKRTLVPSFLQKRADAVAAAVWTDLPADAPAWRRLAVHLLRVLWMAGEGYHSDSCSLRASALTLATMLALVPALAASFAYVRGLGWTGQRLEGLLLQRATILSPEAVSTIVSLVDNISIAGLGLVGALFAVGSAISLLSQIESAFDAVWGNTHGRSGIRKAADAMIMLFLGPVLVAVVASSEAAVRSSAVLTWLGGFGDLETPIRLAFALAWSVLVCGAFIGFYLLLPVSRVGWRSAVLGGVLAGLTWQVAQTFYVDFQIGLGGYNAIYGALAQIPILVFWMWTSWVLVLAGAETVAADQNLRVVGRRYSNDLACGVPREGLALALAVELAGAAFEKRVAPTLAGLAEQVAMPIRNVAEVFGMLDEAGLVHTGGEDQRQCFLSLSPGSIAVDRVIAAARCEDSHDGTAVNGAHLKTEVLSALARVADSRHEALGATSLADLVDHHERGGRAL